MHLSIRKIALLALIGTFVATGTPGRAQVVPKSTMICPQELKIPKFGLSIGCSEPFLVISTPPSPAIAAFQVATGEYPNANLLLLPLALDLNNEAGAARSTEESYRQVGFKDAVVSAHWLSDQWGSPHMRQLVQYQVEGQAFSAAIALLPLEDAHLLLTVLQRGSLTKLEGEKSLDHFSVKLDNGAHSPLQHDLEKASGQGPLTTKVALLILGLAIVAIILSRKRNRTRTKGS